MKKPVVAVSFLAIFLVLGMLIACQGSVKNTDTPTPSSTGSATVTPSPASPSNTPSPTTVTPVTPAAPTTPVPSGTPTIKPTPSLEDLNAPVKQVRLGSQDYVVFAWNDLGMHCLNPTFDTAVILPPYNTIWAQVVRRGNPPQIVTNGVKVDYRIVNNTYSYGKRSFGQFWDYVKQLFGVELEKDTGLNLSDPNVHNGLSGPMAVQSDHFEAVGIPLVPVDDAGNWSPYQVAEIIVTDNAGNMLAQTRTMAPVSDEMNCAKCHGSDTYNDILQKHDQLSGTNLANQTPVLCASCHGDPALGNTKPGVGYLSASMHGFHAGVASPPSCYDCHPGQNTQCSRSLAHMGSDGNCTSCHGDLSQVASSVTQGNRIPWANEPECATCHFGVEQVDTGDTLYRHSTGHGGMYCASCHSSPHAMVPTNQQADNYQALQYQGKAVPIGSCAACHASSKGGGEGGGMGEFAEAHAGSNPERMNTCYVCHTAINTNTSQWPHSFQWQARPN
jgi:hypothetical protein